MTIEKGFTPTPIKKSKSIIILVFQAITAIKPWQFTVKAVPGRFKNLIYIDKNGWCVVM